MIRVLAAAALMLTAAGPAFASAWEIDYAASRLGFTATVGGVPVEGGFADWQATIVFDETALDGASAVVIIEMASADTGDATRDSTLLGRDFFATELYPQGVFESTGFRATGDNAFEMDGMLTMRDVSLPVVIPFTLERDADGGVTARGAVTVDRSDFGIGQGDFAGEGTVAYPVRIALEVVADPAP